MPTRIGGLPQRGEVWVRTFGYPYKNQEPIAFVVIERSRGDHWSLRVWIKGKGRVLWVDPAYWFSQGELQYAGEAGPKTRKKAGI